MIMNILRSWLVEKIAWIVTLKPIIQLYSKEQFIAVQLAQKYKLAFFLIFSPIILNNKPGEHPILTHICPILF